jgi:hypothetical protein
MQGADRSPSEVLERSRIQSVNDFDRISDYLWLLNDLKIKLKEFVLLLHYQLHGLRFNCCVKEIDVGL